MEEVLRDGLVVVVLVIIGKVNDDVVIVVIELGWRVVSIDVLVGLLDNVVAVVLDGLVDFIFVLTELIIVTVVILS